MSATLFSNVVFAKSVSLGRSFRLTHLLNLSTDLGGKGYVNILNS